MLRYGPSRDPIEEIKALEEALPADCRRPVAVSYGIHENMASREGRSAARRAD